MQYNKNFLPSWAKFNSKAKAIDNFSLYQYSFILKLDSLVSKDLSKIKLFPTEQKTISIHV